MKESDTYQAILEEGEAIGEAKGEAKGEARGKTEEARTLLLRLGTKRFGSPDETVQTAIERLDVLEQLERLLDRLLETENWSELLNGA